MDSNSFTGTIPTQLGQLDMLIFLSAADLALNGMMPSQVCENRGEPTNPANGNLAVLIADCDPADQRVSSGLRSYEIACVSISYVIYFRYILCHILSFLGIL